MSDLIDEWCGIVEPYIDTPKSFIEGAGIFITSTLLGRFVECSIMPSKRPNTWNVISSIPGRARRSSIQSMADKVIHRALYGYHQHIGLKEIFRSEKKQKAYDDLDNSAKAQKDKEYQWKAVQLTQIEEGTAPGIADRITNMPFKELRLCSTEMSAVFQKMALKYNLGVEALFSKMYYGEPGSILLSGGGGAPRMRLIPPNLYVTMFSGMQEPKQCITEHMIRQGLLRRMVIDYKPDLSDRWSPPLNLDRKFVDPKLEKYADKLLEIMKRLSRLTHEGESKLDLMFFPDVYDSINSYSEKLDKELDNSPNLTTIYKQSFWEHLAKFSINRRIARFDNKISTLSAFDLTTLMVEERDYKKSINYLTPIEKNVPYIIESIGTVEIDMPSRESSIERVYRYIQESGVDGILRMKLYRKLGNVLSEDLDKFTKTLVTQGRVCVVPQKDKKGGGVRYKDVRD